MNMQRRSDEESIVLHKAIAKKLRNNPGLWEIPKNNMVKWKKKTCTGFYRMAAYFKYETQRTDTFYT